ncbi:MAG: hypothetical protein IJ081_02140 [Prevotella sp.]|nr:hypothetical protein [Prevotella sp.]
MKKIFTLLVAFLAAVSTSMAQGQHGAMKFSGKASFSVASVTVPVESDTVLYQAAGQNAADITIPSMTYQMGQNSETIPSFVIHGVSYAMDMTTMTANFTEQTFSETITVNSEEKQITGSSLVGAYKHDAFNTFTLTITFTYGRMPMPITYTIEAYYIKTYTDKLDVMIDKKYTVESVAYNVRTYPDGNDTKLDVEVPTFDLPDATIGALTSGGYTVKGLAFDQNKGGYYRDYSADGLKLHFHTASIDGDYPLSNTGANNILVTFDGKKIKIVNNFKPGAMPFLITTTFPGETDGAGVESIKTVGNEGNQPVYNLSGQRVSPQAKGIVIIGGKKYIR